MVKNKLNREIFVEEYIKINSIDQYLFHSGTDSKNPVLLFLHGGPGSPESIFTHLFQEKWEESFTIVHWDQRGSGKTLSKNKKALPTIDLLMEDLHQIVCYLRKKYNQEKIILLGHSWGSVLGTLFIKKYPELISYYIGVGQVVNMLENEKVGYDKLKEVILNNNNKNDLKKLESVGEYPGKIFTFDDIKKLALVRQLQVKYKLAITANLPLILELFKNPIFKLSDLSSLLKATMVNKDIFNYLFTINFNNSYEYKLPIYYILGENDWQTPYTIASEYFQKIDAPNKKLYLIKNAGHMTMVDNKDDFLKALIDIKKFQL